MARNLKKMFKKIIRKFFTIFLFDFRFARRPLVLPVRALQMMIR